MNQPGRRSFLQGSLAAAGLAGAATSLQAQTSGGGVYALPSYARAQDYRSLKQSSHDTTGGNRDYWNIPAGDTKEIFNSTEPGVITHIWFTISSPATMHLKELVLRAVSDLPGVLESTTRASRQSAEDEVRCTSSDTNHFENRDRNRTGGKIARSVFN